LIFGFSTAKTAMSAPDYLQPVSFEGSTGLNVAAGIGGITLTPAP